MEPDRRVRHISAILIRHLCRNDKDHKGKRRASDPLLRPAIQRSKSRSSLESRSTTRGKRSSSISSNQSKASIKTISEVPLTPPTPSGSHLSLATPEAQTARQRAHSLFTDHLKDATRPRGESTASARTKLHALDERQQQAERIHTVHHVLSNMAYCQIVLRTQTHPVLAVSQEMGPSCDFDFELEGLEGEPSTVLEIDVYARYLADPQVCRLALTWSIEIAALVSIGHHPEDFPSFGSNAVIVRFDNGEYFTAPFEKHASFKLPEEETLSEPEDMQSTLDYKRDLLLQHRHLQRARTLDAISRSIKETKMLSSCEMLQVQQLVQLEGEIPSVSSEILALRRSLDSALENNVGWFKRRQKSAQSGSAANQRRNVESVRDRIQNLHASIQQSKDVIKKRKSRLVDARQLIERGHLIEQSLAKDIVARKFERNRLAKQRAFETAKLTNAIDSFFAIAPAATWLDGQLTFTINSLPLPNSEFPANLGLLDDVYSSALGMVAQAVNTLAAYLGVAIFYPLTCAGSRSLVTDPISAMKGPRAFPLYANGVERHRFDYAVLLLNRNIELITKSQGLTIMDLKQTLPNLKNLVLTITGRSLKNGKLAEPKLANETKFEPTTATKALSLRSRSNSVASEKLVAGIISQPRQDVAIL